MTFTIKHKRADRPMVAEYLCPEHGKFALEVDRDGSGDPPGTRPCPRQGMELANPADDDAHFEAHARCGIDAHYCVSAPRVGVRRVEAVRGGWQKPERKTWLDTRNLGEGQELDDFRADREKIRDEERRASLKELIND